MFMFIFFRFLLIFINLEFIFIFFIFLIELYRLVFIRYIKKKRRLKKYKRRILREMVFYVNKY